MEALALGNGKSGRSRVKGATCCVFVSPHETLRRAKKRDWHETTACGTMGA